MKKLELKLLVIVLVIFLLLFVFIPKDKEKTIFNESVNGSNYSNELDYLPEYNQESSVIVKHIISGNSSNEIENLSNKDKFILDKEIEEKNKAFNEFDVQIE